MYALRLKKDLPDQASGLSLDEILARETGKPGMIYLYRLGGQLMCFERSAHTVLSLCKMETALRVSEEGYADYLACVVRDVEALRRAGLKLSAVSEHALAFATGIVCRGRDLLLNNLTPLTEDSRYLEILRGLRLGFPDGADYTGLRAETQNWHQALELYGRGKTRRYPATGQSVLSAGSTLTGDLQESEDLRIDGWVKGGDIHGEKNVVIGPGGNLTGNLTAGAVDVYGCVLGTVTARGSACLRSGCFLRGDLIAGTVEIEPGARFEGQCRMTGGTDTSPDHDNPARRIPG